MNVIRPDTEQALAKAVAQAAADGTRLRIRGADTKAALGAPVKADAVLDVSALAGVEEYEPEELVFTALAGTPLSEVNAMLAEHRQMLAFEPPEFASVLAAFGGVAGDAGASVNADAGTLGGMTAVGMAGPRQILRWSVRDHLLGFTAVNGLGELFKAGGKVVKNVTGYDLSKLMCGSFGTLAVLTRLTFRVLPMPERAITLITQGQDARHAVAAFATALSTPAEVSAACWLPGSLGAHAPEDAGIDGARLPEGKTLTCLRVEGFAQSLKSRAEMLRQALRGHGAWELREGPAWDVFWRSLRDVRPLMTKAKGRWLWRIVLAPANGGALAEALLKRQPHAELFIDRAGGLIWLSLPLPEAGVAAKTAQHLRALAHEHGGQAMLFAAPENYREIVHVFPPLPENLAVLSERVRAQLDPRGILNPGIMDNLPAPDALAEMEPAAD